MIKGWGAAASITFAVAAVVVGVSGCGGDAEAEAKKPAAASAKASGLSDAVTAFQDVAASAYLDDVCTKEAGTCWDKMNMLMDSARDLRKAMNAEKSVGPEFWTEAYTLIDTMEEGLAVGEDLGAAAYDTNRPKVFGSAHDLADWLDAHPIK